MGEYEVTDTISHEDDQVAYLTIDGETITTTPWHLFYTEDENRVEAEDLDTGDTVVSLSGVPGDVESLTIVDETRTMYDLTVADVHTFVVGEGEWVVHNCGKYMPGFEPELKPRPSDVKNADERAKEIASVLGRTANYVTVAVGDVRNPDTGQIHRIVSSSEKNQLVTKNAGVKDELYDYEFPIPYQGSTAYNGGHGENNIAVWAENMVWELSDVGASRRMCAYCENDVLSAGGNPVGEMKGWP